MIVIPLRQDAVLLCGHMGLVQISASQHWVTVEGKALLVDSDPEAKTIAGCPNVASGQPPEAPKKPMTSANAGIVTAFGMSLLRRSVTTLIESARASVRSPARIVQTSGLT